MLIMSIKVGYWNWDERHQCFLSHCFPAVLTVTPPQGAHAASWPSPTAAFAILSCQQLYFDYNGQIHFFFSFFSMSTDPVIKTIQANNRWDADGRSILSLMRKILTTAGLHSSFSVKKKKSFFFVQQWEEGKNPELINVLFPTFPNTHTCTDKVKSKLF